MDHVGIIIAAGIGRRLSEGVDVSNKCLLQVNDVTLLENTIEQLYNHCDRIIVVVGHNHRAIIEACEDIDYVELNFIYNHRYMNTNTVTSVALAHLALGTLDYRHVILVESDLYLNPDCSPIDEICADRYWDASIQATKTNDSGKDEWRVITDACNNIIDIEIDAIEAPCIIGLVKYTYEDFQNAARFAHQMIANKETDQYFDEAERRAYGTGHALRNAVKTFNMQPEQIIEFDTLEDIELAEAKYDIEVMH